MARFVSENLALRVTLLQGALLLTWTLYALFLPQMAQQCGIPARFVLWILIADQVIFMIADWMAGVYAERLAALTRRVGPVINCAGLVSAGTLAAMPAVAGFGNAKLWLFVVVVWAASSSFLRAPAFSLLSRFGGVSRKSGVVSWALVGVCLASAVGPLLTTTLEKVDPALPLLTAAAMLATAAWLAGRVEPVTGSVPGSVPVHQIDTSPAVIPSLLLGLCVLLGAFGAQVHTQVVPTKTSGLVETVIGLWNLLFWVGFAGGLMLGARLARVQHMHPWAGLVVLMGAIALYLAPRVTDPVVFAPVQLSAGAAWAIVFMLALTLALSHGGRGGLASPIGLVFSAIAAAAVARLTLTALKFDWATSATLLSASGWAACAGLLVVHPWIRGKSSRLRIAAR